MTSWKNKRITILGIARSGIASAQYLTACGSKVVLSDNGQADSQKSEIYRQLEQSGISLEFGGHSHDSISNADLIVISPGIKPNSEVVEKAKALDKEIISDLELIYRSTEIPMILITGTNGKSTTTALIAHILENSGLKAPACGNIGTAIAEVIQDKPDYLVVEASSYQLYYSPTLAPKIAIWLNLTPDHLDWHGNLENYIEAKHNLFLRQNDGQFAILNANDETICKRKYNGRVCKFDSKHKLSDEISAYWSDGNLYLHDHGQTIKVVADKDLQIKGKHNVENALAAILATKLAGLTIEKIQAGLKSFTALEHRLEYVDSIDGIAFYNDSKATNPESAINALESFSDQKIVLIAGGKDKGTDLGQFISSIKAHVSHVVLIGEASERFAQELNKANYKEVFRANDLEEACQIAYNLHAGPVVLSPACASFDMFKNFEDRGHVFKDIVKNRISRLAPSL